VSSTPVASPRERLAHFARLWSVNVGDTIDTASSLIAYGFAGGESVVLKIVKARGDEWHAGEVLAAFHGQGTARVHAHADGAVLLERVIPGQSLTELAVSGRDDDATAILAEVIQQMSSGVHSHARPTAHDWGRSFDAYLSSGDSQIPRQLIVDAAGTFDRLRASQTSARLLHGDLQHYNVLRDDRRGWLAIDPKGVIAEVEYEIGAILRNPVDLPALFLDPGVIDRRVRAFVGSLGLDRERILGWAFAQAVLSAIWDVEDYGVVSSAQPALQLAQTLRPIVGC
jgi:streptomycin 6-kinase